MNIKRLVLKFFDGLFSHLVKIHIPSSNKPSEVNKILVIKLSAMGDAICVMPSIRQLRIKYPNSEINWLTTTRTNFNIFNQIKFIDNIILLPTNIFGFIFFIINNFSNFKNYDLIIDFDQYYKVSEFICLQGRFSVGFNTGIKGKKYSNAIFYDPNINERINFMNLVEQDLNSLNLKIDYSLPELLTNYKPSDKLVNIIHSLSSNKRILFIYPGSSDNAIFRRWSIDNFISVALNFQNVMNIIFAGGPDELSFKPIIKNSSIKLLDLINELSLLDWAYFFHRFPNSIFLGNDGGLLHLAESQNIAIIGIFGPALFKKWGSLNPLSISVERDVSCRPCLKGYLGVVPSDCYRGDIACMKISPKEVLNSISILDRRLDSANL